MYLATREYGIVETPKKKPIKSLFCKHRRVMAGESCSKSGMRRISGSNLYAVCMDCGTVLDEQHTDY